MRRCVIGWTVPDVSKERYVTSQTIGIFSTLLPLQAFFVLLFLTLYVAALHNKVDTILQ